MSASDGWWSANEWTTADGSLHVSVEGRRLLKFWALNNGAPSGDLLAFIEQKLPDDVRRRIDVRLEDLRSLMIYKGGLMAIPAEVFQLADLELLDLDANDLSDLPPGIGRLTKLKSLNLNNNRLTRLSPQIGRLTSLGRLELGYNQLTDLPIDLSRLDPALRLGLAGNPLRDPLPELVRRGVPELFAYLRSLDGAHPQYEAKVLLVGEGSVGKTSLVAALRGEPFVVGRPTTHGIELRPLSLPHPELDRDLTLNTWDFGGQEVYRITHQFFFSRRALYLLVWRPREGQEENAIEAWCRRIRLRVGDDARILVVATHADERSPELDYPTLRRHFGELLVGHVAVDNSTRQGIDDLVRTIAAEAARLPQMGELISERWIAARDELQARAQPQVTYQEFAATCQRHGMDEVQTRTFVGLMHDLGHLVYYGDDEGLRDVVVLQPEWLTKAIGFVLEDRPAREAGGILQHARLREIWQERADAAPYPAECHPYFLRLMEKFDVSYRLPEEEGSASLIGQLVPWERPSLPWDGRPPRADVRTLSLRCRLGDHAPGLMAWLTVRNHRFSTGHHWRRGVFLAHRQYASEALFELAGDHLELEVRAPSPDYFFSILRDSLEDLVTRRWPGLEWELMVPCPTVMENGCRCVGQFKLRNLQTFRERGRPRITCNDCLVDHDVARLLTGFDTPALVERFDVSRLEKRLEEVAAGVLRIEAQEADVAHRVRAVLKVVGAEVADCPRLFTLAPVEARGLGRLRAWRHQQRLTLWCEHAGSWHPCPDATYDLTSAHEWLVQVAPYASLVLRALHLLVPVAAAASGVIWSEEQLKAAKHEIELTRTLVDRLPQAAAPRAVPDVEKDWAEGGLGAAEGAGLRALRQTLLERDAARWFGGLRRVLAPTGDLLWVCPEHYPEYDPGLPTLP